MKYQTLRFFRSGILANESGQDTVEYLALATVMVVLCGIVMTILLAKIESKSGAIKSIWSNHSP